MRNKVTKNINNKSDVLSGLYRGFVVDNNDPQKMGRIKIQIPALYSVGSNQNNNSIGSVWCRMALPFGGTTEIVNDAQQSYGVSYPPPSIGNEVIVGFTKDIDKGIILGVLLDNGKNTTLAGPIANKINEKYTQTHELSKTKDKKSDPKEHIQSNQLRKQGLFQDTIRGLNFSNPRQHEKNNVSSFSTPQGHAITMDDNENNIIRIRSSLGSQLLLDDKHGSIYAINRDGNCWLEMDSDGNFHIYSDKSFNVHTKGDFNIRAEGNINMESTDGINIKSGTDTKLQSIGSTNINSGSNNNITGGNFNNFKSGNTTLIEGGIIHLNGPSPLDAIIPKVIITSDVDGEIKESICSVIPEREPWSQHKDTLYLDEDKVLLDFNV